VSELNEVDYPEIDEKPFVVFKFRRIKKKFKKYIKSNNEFLTTQRDDESDSSNVLLLTI
jgi:hypothetical protein